MTAISFGDRVYRVAPDMRLICDIEDELGGIAPLAARLARGDWTASELVALVQMLLQSAGETVDYRVLGDGMLKEGLGRHAARALDILNGILGGSKA